MAKVIVRTMIDTPIEGVPYKCNQLVEIDENIAKAHKSVLDTSKEGIEYCKSEKIEVVKHEKAKQPKTESEDKE